MKRYLVIMVFFLVSVLLIAGCGTKTTPPASTTASATPTQVVATPTPTSTTPVVAKKIKFAYTMPKGASIGAGFEWFATEFPKRTQGRYIVETYPSNTLVPVNSALDSVKAGTAEMVGTSTGTFPKAFPLTLVVSIPTLGFPGGVISSYVEAMPSGVESQCRIKNELKDFKLLWTYMLDPYSLASKSK
jgi:TRAP-type C4-dicarboxylate transport system substrate-binding protein